MQVQCLHRTINAQTRAANSQSDSRSFVTVTINPTTSSETQGQLVGTTGFSWAKVYKKSGRTPGHLLLPNEFQKRLKSRLLNGQKIFFSDQSAKRNSRATLMSSYTRLFPSSIALVAWPVQREHF